MSDDNLLESSPASNSAQRLWLKRLGLILIGLAIGYVMFVATGQKGKYKVEEKEQPVSLGSDLLMEDRFEQFKQQNAQTKEMVETTQAEAAQARAETDVKINDLSSQLSQLQKLMLHEQEVAANKGKQENKPPLSNDPARDRLPQQRYPEPPNPPLGTVPTVNEAQVAEPTRVGGTAFFEFAPIKKKGATLGKEQYWLPPSLMSAKLLTGIDASTSQSGADEPKTIMFMVDAPAVLPNHIRQDLSGCFVMANANGDLGTERIEVIVVNLSCLSADGNAVIDQPVLGFVNDIDGKRDMAGNVVSKEGSKLAWLFSASLIGAAGTQASLSGVEQNLTALGGVNTFDPGRAVQRSLGESVQETASEYKSIVIDYIRQSAPTIEVGPLKDVTVVIQEGVWLEIKSRQKQGLTAP